MLGTDYREYPDRKHFGYPDPLPEFPEALEAVLAIAALAD
jgi:hypothetical protein